MNAGQMKTYSFGILACAVLAALCSLAENPNKDPVTLGVRLVNRFLEKTPTTNGSACSFPFPATWWIGALPDWWRRGASVPESRHYASMAIDGDDLVVLSRSGSPQAKSPHNGDMITFHRIRDFRSLVY